MELLLNLAWLLLALPAIWLWRASRPAPAAKFKSLQCLLALACMLVILFPVVSATDDLHAMRAEMEESPAGKRTVRQANNDKTPTWKGQTPPALVSPTRLFIATIETWRPFVAPHLLLAASPAVELASRAPPVSFAG